MNFQLIIGCLIMYVICAFATGAVIANEKGRYHKTTARYWLTCWAFPLWWFYGIYHIFKYIVPTLWATAFPKRVSKHLTCRLP